PFTIHGASALIDRIAIEIELHDVVENDQLRRAGPRHKKPIRALRMPHADMAETVDHPFPRQDAIGDHQIFKLLMQCCGHASTLSLPLFSARARGAHNAPILFSPNASLVVPTYR